MPLIVHTNKKKCYSSWQLRKSSNGTYKKTVSYFSYWKHSAMPTSPMQLKMNMFAESTLLFSECAFFECHFLLAPIFFAFIVIFVCCIPFYLHLTRMLSAWTATVRPYLEWMLHWLFVVIRLLFLLILSICFSRFIFFFAWKKWGGENQI